MTQDDRYREYEHRYRTAYELGAVTWRQVSVDDELVRFLRVSKVQPGRAIDLGCGEGVDAIWLARQGWQVVGVDLSPSAISRARELASEAGVKIEFQVGNVLDLSVFPDSSFDLAVNVFTLHLLVEAEHRALHLREIHRLLRPGGWLFLDNLGRSRGLHGQPLRPGQLSDYELQVRREKVRVTLPAVPSVRLSRQETAEEVARAGLVVRRIQHAGRPDYRRVVVWAFKPHG